MNMNHLPNVDDREVAKFDAVAQRWWDIEGDMRNLHVINPLRTAFVLDNINVPQPKILDVGCGGGILSEALAKKGAQVTAIDLSQPTLEAARRHAGAAGLMIDYRAQSAEQLVEQRAECFDAVTCMEMLEHVPHPAQVIASCAKALRPGGHAFFSTIDRSYKAFLFAIVMGEYVLRLLPRGTHTYKRLIRPREMLAFAQACGLEWVSTKGLTYNPLTRQFKVVAGEGAVNYMVHFIKKG